MAQRGSISTALHKRQRRRGESVMGCLLAIAIVIGGSIWFYFQFIHWKPLVKAGENHKTFPYKRNIPAYLEYGRRFRTGFDFGSKGMCLQNYELIKRFKKGEYKDDPDRFQQEAKEFMNQLLDSVVQFDGQEVPDVLEKSHAAVSKAHGLCYESILELKAAAKEEGAAREALVKAAEAKAKAAWERRTTGVKTFYITWDKTRT